MKQAGSHKRVLSCDEASLRAVQRGWITFSIDPVVRRIDAPKYFPDKCCCCLAATRASWNVSPMRFESFPPVSVPICPKCRKSWKRRLLTAAGAIFGVLAALGVGFGWLIEIEPLGYSGILLVVAIATISCTFLAARFCVAPAIVPPQSSRRQISIWFRHQKYAAIVWDWSAVKVMPSGTDKGTSRINS